MGFAVHFSSHKRIGHLRNSLSIGRKVVYEITPPQGLVGKPPEKVMATPLKGKSHKTNPPYPPLSGGQEKSKPPQPGGGASLFYTPLIRGIINVTCQCGRGSYDAGMEWKNIATSTLCAGLFMAIGFYVEGEMFPLGDERWLYLAGLMFIALIWINRKDIASLVRKRKPEKEPEKKEPKKTIDSMEAMYLIGKYLEPALQGNSRAIVIHGQFLEYFEKVVGAKTGEHEYNAELLHQWMQSNAARFLIENQGKMR